MNAEADLRAYLDACRARVDVRLASAFPTPPDCPPVLHEAMQYSLMAGGKRLRPILVLAAADAVAERLKAGPETVDLALPLACALELIHTYSLVHDDLPSMDDDTLRRGRPTAHVVFGEGMAILSGDGLLTEAFALLAREPDDRAVAGLGARKLRTIRLVAAAAGAAGMVGGQAIDLLAAGRGPATRPGSLDADGLRDMHARKTGALIRAAAAGGAVMAGAPDDLVEAVDAYAAELGLAFQIVDDILDVEGAAEALGKTAGKDAAAGKPTYPALFGLDRSRRLAAECVDRAVDRLARAGLRGRLSDIARWVISRTH